MINSKILFLLGGADLEMLAIKKILDEKKVQYFDKNLAWGASVNDYAEIFNDPRYNESIIYGIELSEPAGWQKPANYAAIDHHNERQSDKSSLEQVAGILNIELTRAQMLIAANDRGYIPAMLEICASWDEIITDSPNSFQNLIIFN